MSRKRLTPVDSELPPTVVLDGAVNPSQKNGAIDESQLDFEFEQSESAEHQKIGRYRIQHELGSGGMGVVLHAYDELLERDVAIKLIRRRFLKQPKVHRRFVKEALLTSRLQHPCIVPIYDLGLTEDERPYFAMKLISGQSLASLLSNTPAMQQDRSQLLKIFERVCQSLAYAHSQHILHLDIKPANIMVGTYGEVHMMDWGLARECKPLDVNGSANSEGRCELAAVECEEDHIGGTPAYMSPEQARGETVNASADVFGLGALLCEILTGSPPFRGSNLKRIHARAMRGKLENAFLLLDQCNRDARLIHLAKQCLSPRAVDRPPTAADVASALNGYLESALEQAESDICRFFDLTLDLFCIATMDGYFSRINVNFPKVLGYSEQTLISQPFIDFVHPDDVSDTVEVMKDLLIGKPVVRFCNRYRHAAGHYILLEWTAQAIPNEGNIFAVARDITKR